MVTARGEARTAGVVPHVHQGEVWFASKDDEWKIRHIRANPHVSVTATIQRGIGPIPPATITCAGHARVIAARDAPQVVAKALTRGISEKDLDTGVLVAIEPRGDFVTYGIGTSLLGMRNTELARGRIASR